MPEMLPAILLIAVAVLFATNAVILILTWRHAKTKDKIKRGDEDEQIH